MSAIFKKECNYLLEAKIFLTRYFSKETMRVIHEHLKQRANYTQEKEHTLNILEKVYQEIEKQLEVPMNLNVYFSSFDEEDLFVNTLSDCMLIQGINEKNIPLEELGSYMKTCYHENKTSFVNAILYRDDDDEQLSEDVFMEELSKIGIKDELKWHIWTVYKNFDEHLDKLLSSMIEVVRVIKKVYKKYEQEFQSFYEYWQEICENDLLDEKTQDIIDFKFKDIKQITVRPTWMGCNSIRVLSNDNKIDNLQIQIGLMFMDNQIFEEVIFSKEEICARLKLFSDTSKYEILKLVKKERMYGSQLAEALGLTTATISHHISSLTSKGFISIEKDANRIYYRINKAQIANVLDQIRKDLYEDESL